MVRRACLFLVVVLAAAPVQACRQALSLGLDVSSSVDDTEYRLQLNGVIAALTAPAVQDVLLQNTDMPVRLQVFEWAGPEHQRVIVPWITLRDAASVATVTAALRRHRRGAVTPTTAIGAAILAGYAYLDQQEGCWKRTLDLSGDGQNNAGPAPLKVTAAQRPANVTVNGLVIGVGNLRGDDERFSDIKHLSSYYRTRVIRGPGAFVEVALGYQDYAAAMERKLLRELSSIVLGAYR